MNSRTPKVEQQLIVSNERVALEVMQFAIKVKGLNHEHERAWWGLLFGLALVAVGFSLVVIGNHVAGTSLLVVAAGTARRLFLRQP